VFGWGELTRRLLNHPILVQKYFGQLLGEIAPSLRHEEIHQTHGFVGREQIIDALEEALFDDAGRPREAPLPVAICGLGGVGKTTLAREFAWRNRERYVGIWWLRAGTIEDIVLGLVELGQRLPGGPGAPSVSSFEERRRTAKKVLSVLADPPFTGAYLLVYDDAESPIVVRDWLPWAGAHVLCTTRWSSDWHGIARELPLQVFPPGDAVRFLEARAGRQDATGAERLAGELGYLPLALDHAGAYCKETLMGFADYRARVNELIRTAPEVTSYPKSVFATFDLCIVKAAQIAPQAEKLMAILAVLAPERIPMDLIHDGCMTVLDRGAAVAALLRVSLISAETATDGRAQIRVHRLVQQVMRHRLTSLGATAEAVAAAMLLLTKAFPIDDSSKQWPKCAELASHAISVLAEAPTRLDGLDDSGWLAHRKFQLDERVSRYRESMASIQRFDAMMSFEENRRSAELLAKDLGGFKPEYRHRYLRIALERPDNPNLQPLRDALSSFPPQFQEQMRAEATLAVGIANIVRDLALRRDYETIGKMVVEHFEDFPMRVQMRLDKDYTKGGNSAFMAYVGRRASGEMREWMGENWVKREAGPIEAPNRETGWAWLVPWRRRSSTHAK
jgi:hypothetical protein